MEIQISSQSKPISKSNLSLGDARTSIDGEKNFGSVDFPSLNETYGVNGVLPANPRIGISSQIGMDRIIHGEVESSSVLEKSSKNGAIGVNSNPNSDDWRTLFPPAKPITPQPSMKFTPPSELNGQRVVDYSAGDFTKGIKRCEEYVVGFCVGKRLSFPAVKDAVKKHWKLKNEVSIKLHSNCAFIFEFKDDEDRKKVLELGSFYISNCLFTLRPWSNLIESSIASIKTLPIWVLIFGVPLHMWDNEGLSLISSYLGKPLLADDCTLMRTRLSYARICVEVDVDFHYPESIPLMIDGKIALEMPVEYQWKPPKCESCKVFGHSSKNCTKKLKPKWNPKFFGKVNQKIQSRATGDDVCGEQQGETLKGIVGDNSNVSQLERNGLSEDTEIQVIENGGSLGSIGVTKEAVAASTNSVAAFGPISARVEESSAPASGSKDVEEQNLHVDHSASALALAKSGSNRGSLNPSDSVQGEWKDAKVKSPPKKRTTRTPSPKKITKTMDAPKRNPFLMLSDFREESRFPIDSRKLAAQKTEVSAPSKMATADKVVIQEVEEDSEEELDNCEFERKLNCLSFEDKISKRKERDIKRKDRELQRLNWNGNQESSNNKQEQLGRGHRSQKKKGLS